MVLVAAGRRFYRGGSNSPSNLTPRPGVDTTGLSTFDSLAAFKPGDKVQVIDTSLLDKLRAVPDAEPPGHVSVRPPDLSEISDWASTRGTDEIHPYTQELKDAIIDQVKVPKS